MDVYPTTRKLVARGIKTGNTGSQFLVYDLVTRDLIVVPNPDGVASIGAAAAQQAPPGPGTIGIPGGLPCLGGAAPVLTRITLGNPKANTVSAVGLDDVGKQAGVVVVGSADATQYQSASGARVRIIMSANSPRSW